jgi:hypothetical protein
MILGKIGFECISAHAKGLLKAVGRKPSGEGSFADYWKMQLHQCPDLTVSQ